MVQVIRTGPHVEDLQRSCPKLTSDSFSRSGDVTHVGVRDCELRDDLSNGLEPTWNMIPYHPHHTTSDAVGTVSRASCPHPPADGSFPVSGEEAVKGSFCDKSYPSVPRCDIRAETPGRSREAIGYQHSLTDTLREVPILELRVTKSRELAARSPIAGFQRWVVMDLF